MNRCPQCGTPLPGRRLDTRFCSPKCRVAFNRAIAAVEKANTPVDGRQRTVTSADRFIAEWNGSVYARDLDAGDPPPPGVWVVSELHEQETAWPNPCAPVAGSGLAEGLGLR